MLLLPFGVQIMRFRDLEYNLVSRTLGAPKYKIAVKILLPQILSIIMTLLSQMLPVYISYEAFFITSLVLVYQLTTPSLGRLIANYSSNNHQCLSILDTTDWYWYWYHCHCILWGPKFGRCHRSTLT